MLEKIMDLVQGEVSDKVKGMSEVPEEKKKEVISTTTESLVDGFRKYATPDNVSKLTSMLGMGGGSTSAAGMKGMGSGLESGVASALTSKVGLSPSLAQKIAGAVIPAAMSLFSKKIGDDNEPGFNLKSLIGGLSGKNSAKADNSGGIMDLVGNILK